MKTPKYRYKYRSIITKCDCKYGAPMGRCSIGEKPIKGTIYTYEIPIDFQGYDRGGAYWGLGSPLFVEFNATLTYVKFYRK